MGQSNIRVGRVSSIDYQAGMISVTYADREESVTDTLPVLTYGNEYHMPDIGELVLVVHLSNGTSRGVVTGTFWNETNRPTESGKYLYRKEYASKRGEAYCRYDERSKELLFAAAQISMQDDAEKINLLEKIRDLETRIQALERG